MVDSNPEYDVVIIGAGVVGLFIARELSKYKLSILVIEKERDIGWGASKGNAGVIHAFQTPLNSLKGRLCIKGNEMYDKIARELELRFKRVGLLLISLNIIESLILLLIYVYFRLRGLKVKWISGKKLRILEPRISKNARMALLFPTAGIICPFELLSALMENALQNGVEFLFETEVERVVFEDKKVKVLTSKGNLTAKWVINAAGVYADIIAERSGLGKFKIIPRRGAHIIFNIKWPYKHLLAEVPLKPDPKTKGGGALLTIEGKALWGPNLDENTTDRDDTSVKLEDYYIILSKYSRLLPWMSEMRPIKAYAGVRAASNTGDFIIEIARPGFINVAGIQSPGLTAAPAIAELVIKMLSDHLKLELKEKYNPKRKRMIRVRESLNELDKLIEIDKSYGKIICTCELVSEAEIKEAISRGARTIDGIKFRTGLAMGECQGAYCIPKLTEFLLKISDDLLY